MHPTVQRSFGAALAATLSLTLLSSRAPATTKTEERAVTRPADLEWAQGAQGLATAIAEGDPTKPGLFTMMLRLDDGAWIPPHFHNVDKRLVVIEGTLLLGSGQSINASETTELGVGGVTVVPAEAWHFEGAQGSVLVALIAEGPFQTTFVQ